MLDRRSENSRFVADNYVFHYLMTAFGQEFTQQPSTCVGVFGPCVAHGDDRAADMARGCSVVFGVAHRR